MKKTTLFLFKVCAQSSVWLLLALSIYAQSKVITGKVTDSQDNSPLPGVTVQVKNGKTGTQTGADGSYRLTVPADGNTIIFSFVGYQQLERAVASAGTINVALVADVKSLQDVVVVGYGTQKKSEVTSAVTSVKAEDFRQGGARNALDLIQGKVAGLAITRTSGTNPNSGVAIQLRGATSLTGSISPLIVIDGIPGGNLDLLQQDDVASIDVLKDGSAAAIYGTQANGGVILITTKRGRSGPMKVDYASYIRKEYVQRRPKFLTGEEFAAKIASGEIKTTDRGNRTDFLDLLINHANLTQNHNLAFSGGNDKSTYRVSLYYQDLQGIAKENARQQYGGRVSITSRGLQDRLSLQLNLTTNFNKANMLGGGGWEGYLTANPTTSPYNPDGSWLFERNGTNELARLSQETNRRQQQTTSGDAKLGLEIIKGLKASIFASVQRDSWLDGAYRLQKSESSKENYDSSGYASQNTELKVNYAVEPTLEYVTTIAKDHNLTAITGYSYRYGVEQGFNANNWGFLNDVFQENKLDAGSKLTEGKAGMNSYKNDNTLIAFFGRVNYAYKNKYMAQVIFRREGSSRFGANNKWGNFPAVSAGWNIKEERFMNMVPVVDALKLRVGYGITGNSGIANYASLVTMGTGGNYIYPDGFWRQTYGPNRNPNPDLRWEKKKEWNIGVDFSLFKGRLSGAIDVYKRTTEDLLETFTSQQPPFIRESIYVNVGSISARGVELTLSGIPVTNKNFTWNVDLAASTNNTRLDKFSNDLYKLDFKTYGDIGGAGALGNAIRTNEGERLGNFYGKRFAGFTDDGKWLFYKKDGSKVTFDKINSQQDHVVLGNAIPKFYASLTNTFHYKNLDLRIFMRGKFGYKILNTMELAYGNKVAVPNNVLRTAFTKHAKLNDTYQYSDYYLEKGDHVKIDEITLGYNFSFKNTPIIRNLRVYVTGGNLFTITGYSGNDPDFIRDTGLNPGIDALNTADNRSPYISTRSFMIGLNVGF
ncbi:SusC/RagA family TonB-linked outer membrane protein [Chitinophaga pendula]|uniref:SusC/RagA family TonB-linked outer membrane protein n=1 Tax=Chitinophaga TaxID=79328 RepID=UPI000BAE9FBA|nr:MULTISPECIES: SusC/RagA family TonB-linked outer membrane protein [Chitinophaga]ASZ12816.1 SusC/RagA family TonB-linked outer membrane protein [Chitinophaga sp. MD30]UCJ09558.1 SusC/RagA family TonB-linked outer membrane protein [Chitinophaga pendula]